MNKKDYLNINVYDLFGDKLTVEDAVIMRNQILTAINTYNIVCVDFDNIEEIPNNFYSTLLSHLLSYYSKEEIYAKLSFINVKNISNFKRAYYGTSNLDI